MCSVCTHVPYFISRPQCYWMSPPQCYYVSFWMDLHVSLFKLDWIWEELILFIHLEVGLSSPSFLLIAISEQHFESCIFFPFEEVICLRKCVNFWVTVWGAVSLSGEFLTLQPFSGPPENCSSPLVCSGVTNSFRTYQEVLQQLRCVV